MKSMTTALLAIAALFAANATASVVKPVPTPKVETKTAPNVTVKDDAKSTPHSYKKCFKRCMAEVDDRDKCNYVCDDRIAPNTQR
jgi:hypothetical protein